MVVECTWGQFEGAVNFICSPYFICLLVHICKKGKSVSAHIVIFVFPSYSLSSSPLFSALAASLKAGLVNTFGSEVRIFSLINQKISMFIHSPSGWRSHVPLNLRSFGWRVVSPLRFFPFSWAVSGWSLMPLFQSTVAGNKKNSNVVTLDTRRGKRQWNHKQNYI